MYLTTTLYQKSQLSLSSETKICFIDGIEFSVVVQDYDKYSYGLHIQDVKGTLNTLEIAPDGEHFGLDYDDEKDCFIIDKERINEIITFYVLLDIEYKVVTYPEAHSTNSKIQAGPDVPPTRALCNIKVSADRLKFLNVNECYADFIFIEGYENVKLNCFIKKPKTGFIDLTIERAYGVIIADKDDEYTHLAYDYKEISFTVSLKFNPKTLKEINEQIKGFKNVHNDGKCVTYIARLIPTENYASKAIASLHVNQLITNDSITTNEDETKICLKLKHKLLKCVPCINSCCSFEEINKEESFQKAIPLQPAKICDEKPDYSRFSAVKYFFKRQTYRSL